jgi:hypothetical protein
MVNIEQINIDENLQPDEDQRIILLPQNYELTNKKEDLFFNEEIKTVSKMFSLNSLDNYIIKFNGDEIDNYIAQKSGEIILPSIFISSLILTENPQLVSVALGVISNYATTLLKGIPKRNQNVKFKIINKNSKTKEFTKIEYNGNVEGISELAKVVKGINK